jgi:hypothetical protein
MSVITHRFAPAGLLFPPVEEPKQVFANREPGLAESSPICEPERRFWKPPVRPADRMFGMIELFVLVLFLTLALAGIASCFLELSHLLQSDAVGQVAAKAINGGV